MDSQPVFREVTTFDTKVSPSDCYFYHTTDLLGRGQFKGRWDIRGYEDAYLGRYPFRGKTAFDCGVASGFLAFEMERLGAKVIGFDLDESTDPTMGLIPYPDYEARFGFSMQTAIEQRREDQRKLRNSFFLCREAYHSKVRLMMGNLMTHAIPETADVALFGSILLHLRDPLAALYNVAAHVREAIIVSEPLEIQPLSLNTPPTMLFRPSFEDTNNAGTWWYLQPSAIRRMLSTVGFGDVTAEEIRFKCEPEGNEVAGYCLVARRTHAHASIPVHTASAAPPPMVRPGAGVPNSGLGAHPLAPHTRTSLWHLVQHYTDDFTPQGVINAADSKAADDDEAIAARLLNIFHRMLAYEIEHIAPENRPNSGVWEMVRHEFHGEFYRIMASRNVADLAAYLRNGLRRSIAYGLGLGDEVFRAMSDGGEGQSNNLALLADRLASLAVAIGALPQENPEQGRYGINLQMPVVELVRCIEARLGKDIHRPLVAGLFGVEVGPGRIVDHRVPDDVYCAFRLETLRNTHGARRVCEIGAGFGGTAFQASRHGIEPYTIVDLPSVNILQAYFLMKTFGADAVSLFGEDAAGRRFNVQPYWMFFSEELQFDLVLNRDSMPEMPEPRAREYLQEMERRGCAFLSINQEAEADAAYVGVKQLIVHRLAASYPGLRSAGRAPYWVRKGYVEELFLPAKRRPSPVASFRAGPTVIRQAVILAGGLGTRLIGRDRDPAQADGRDRRQADPVAHHEALYAKHGVDEFVICLGYKGYVIKEYFANYYLHHGRRHDRPRRATRSRCIAAAPSPGG